MFSARVFAEGLSVAVLVFPVASTLPLDRECYADNTRGLGAIRADSCAGLPTDNCATFVVGVYDELDTWLGVLPVSSDPPPRSINFNEIVLDDCTDTKITFEIKIHGWDPDHDCVSHYLEVWEVDLDSSDYAFDIVGYMTPEIVGCGPNGRCSGGPDYNQPCDEPSDCRPPGRCVVDNSPCLAAWGGVCTVLRNACTQDTDCYDFEDCGGAPCDYPTGVGGHCSPGFQYIGRSDGLLLTQLPFVDVTTLDFRYGAMLSPAWMPFCDTGIDYYGGTLKLVTSGDVAGMAAVLTAPTSFMKDGWNNPIPLTGLVHAYVICQTGQCCDMEELPPACVSDTVTEQQCAALVGGAYYWDSTKTCADPCCECLEHVACADGDACTVDRCADCLCESTPITLAPDECCAWVPADLSADLNGLGEITNIDDGNPCTDDGICDDPGSCALGAQCGVPIHSYSPQDTPCEVGGVPCMTGHCNGSGQCVLDNNICGACCLPNGSCTGGLTQAACVSTGGEFMGIGTVCLGDSNHDGKDDLCACPACVIPTVSQWGLAAMLLLLLAAAKIGFRRRVRHAPS